MCSYCHCCHHHRHHNHNHHPHHHHHNHHNHHRHHHPHHHSFYILISYAELIFSHWCPIAFVSICLPVLSFHQLSEPKSFKKKNWREHCVWRWMSFIGLDRERKFQFFLPTFLPGRCCSISHHVTLCTAPSMHFIIPPCLPCHTLGLMGSAISCLSCLGLS